MTHTEDKLRYRLIKVSEVLNDIIKQYKYSMNAYTVLNAVETLTKYGEPNGKDV